MAVGARRCRRSCPRPRHEDAPAPLAPRSRPSPPSPLFAALGTLRHTPDALRGDEGSYVAMAASLAARRRPRFHEPRRGVGALAAGTPGGADPRAHVARRRLLEADPLSARGGPVLRLAGDAGFWIFNALALDARRCCWRAPRSPPRGRRGGAADGAALRLRLDRGAVSRLAMTESLQVALATAGLALALSRRARSAEPAAGGLADRLLASPAAPWVGMALLGLLVGLREPNAAVAAVPVLAALGARRPRRAAALAAVTAATYAPSCC
jgi:hypothetical protein